MIWQDIVIMLCLIGLGVFAIPSIFKKNKPPKLMAVSYAIILLVITTMFATLQLWLSAGAQALCTIAWGILAVQKRRKR